MIIDCTSLRLFPLTNRMTLAKDISKSAGEFVLVVSSLIDYSRLNQTMAYYKEKIKK